MYLDQFEIMTRKTLTDAVLDVAVRNFTFPPKTFSAYDITKRLRADVNDKHYSVVEFEGVPSQHAQEINHSSVRQTIQSLHDKKFFDRTYNGTYFEYAISINNPAPAFITPVVPEPTGVVWDAIVNGVHNLLGIDKSKIKADSTFSSIGGDELDLVELAMMVEEDLKVGELDIDAFASKNITLRKLFDEIVTQSAKMKQTAVKAPPLKTVPLLNASSKGCIDCLDTYIKSRHKKGINPVLKNAQKYLREHGYQTTVSEIRTIAESLTHYVACINHKDPFSAWTICPRGFAT